MFSLVYSNAFGAEGAVITEDHDLGNSWLEFHHLPCFFLGLILELLTQLGGIVRQFDRLVSLCIADLSNRSLL